MHSLLIRKKIAALKPTTMEQVLSQFRAIFS
jgi:hypothetical protein